MIEPGYNAALSNEVQKDIDTLQKRVNHQRRRSKQAHQVFANFQDFTKSFATSPLRTLRHLPARYLLHTLVALLVPIALGLSNLPTLPIAQPVVPQTETLSDIPTQLGPLNVGADANTRQRIGDPPLPETDALPMPISMVSRREAMAPVVVPAKISFARVHIRNGPGLDYDRVATLTSDTSLEVIGRHGEWMKVRKDENSPTYWVAGELLDIPQAAIYTLFDVPESVIPPPPPPKVGMVRESNLNLRDGPGTNYVSMIGLDAGQSFALIERYQDWMHIASNDHDGWVKTEFLDIEPSIMKRVPATEYIPDPNPALVGTTVDNLITLREGPGKVYYSMGTVNVGVPVDLLARYGDWYKVQLRDGTVAWIFSDLLDITPMAKRRVPYTNDIPAEPAPVQVASYSTNSTAVNSTVSSDVGGGGGYNAVNIPASGDVASYAMRFVGYPYVYGGASPGGGFDCSGLMQYVYRQYGVYLPRVAAAQYSTAYGAAVGSMSNLAPGDLMFFAGTSGPGISHVAMYIGGGSMVHAMTPSLGVGVSNIWEGYWVGHYYGAIRPYR